MLNGKDYNCSVYQCLFIVVSAIFVYCLWTTECCTDCLHYLHSLHCWLMHCLHTNLSIWLISQSYFTLLLFGFSLKMIFKYSLFFFGSIFPCFLKDLILFNEMSNTSGQLQPYIHWLLTLFDIIYIIYLVYNVFIEFSRTTVNDFEKRTTCRTRCGCLCNTHKNYLCRCCLFIEPKNQSDVVYHAYTLLTLSIQLKERRGVVH